MGCVSRVGGQVLPTSHHHCELREDRGDSSLSLSLAEASVGVINTPSVQWPLQPGPGTCCVEESAELCLSLTDFTATLPHPHNPQHQS